MNQEDSLHHPPNRGAAVIMVTVLTLTAILLGHEAQQCASTEKASPNKQGQSSLSFPSNSCACENEQPAQNQSPHWYTPLKRPEWWLVILAIPTLIFVGWQARETARSAKAAQGNAEALINSERAWVIAELVPICVKFGVEWHRPAGNG
jgi:hypothetical protein